MDINHLTLLTDLYELTMMQGYFKTGNDETVVFDVFYRDNPSGSGYAITCGLDQVIDYIKNLSFSYDDIDYLRNQGIFDEDFLEYLAGYHFTGDIYAIAEGTVVFPREPLLKVKAPIMEAQLVETALLNIINHQSLIATKASRVVYAAGGSGVMEFGLRRAQGPDAGTYGARAAVIGGCDGTSNVLAGKCFDIPIRVFEELRAEGHMPKHYGIRLDSGDLAYLTKKARIMLDEAGFPDAVIAASGDLDENLITSLKSQGAPITSWGVGTKLITSADCPAFGGVYKLAASKPKGADEFTAKIKISENPAKITNPGNKTIYRIYGKEDGKIRGDLICLVGEHYDESDDLTIFDPQATWKKSTLAGGTYTMRELLVPIFIKGQCVYKSPSVMDIRSYCKDELNTLWDESRRLVNPQEVYVDLSMPLYKLKNELLDAHHKK